MLMERFGLEATSRVGRNVVLGDSSRTGVGSEGINGYPDAPCMEYLPTFGEKWLHSRGNVGKYSLHGAFGLGSMG